MQRVRWLRFAPVLFPAFLVAGCAGPNAGTEKGEQAAPAPAVSAEDAAQKVADLVDQAGLAQRKLDRAQLDLEQGKRDADVAVAKALAELELAKQDAAHFTAVEMPQRIASAQLDLQQTADGMAEQQEEMQQLELMYAKDDLGDKTKEIVLVRGKRRLDRAKQRLELATKSIEDLKTVELPKQRMRLELAVKDKEAELMRAEFGAKAGAADKQTAAIAAQQELAKAQRELAKAKKAQQTP